MQSIKFPFRTYLRQHPFLRQWLIIIIGLSLFSLILIYDLIHEREKTLHRAEARLQSYTRLIEDNLSAQLGNANTILFDIIQDMPALSSGLNGQINTNRRLQAMARAISGVPSIAIVNARGRVINSNNPGLMDKDLSLRGYFNNARRANDPQTLYVTPPFTTVTGNFVITLARSYTRSDGSFGGIVVANLEADYFSTLLRSVLHAPDMWSAVIHEDGKLFVVEPHEATAQTEQALNSGLLGAHFNSGGPGSIQRGRSLISRENRITAVLTIQPGPLHMDKGLVIAISRNEASVLAEWYETATALGFAMFAAFVLTIGLQLYNQRVQANYESEMRQARTAMHLAESRFTTAFNEAPIGMLLRNADGHLLQVNHALAGMLGYTLKELRQLPLEQLFFPEDRETDQHFMQEILLGRRTEYHTEVRLTHRNGHAVWALLSASAVLDPHGKLQYLIKHIQDITLLKQQASELEQLAHYDKLTKLPNRTLLADRMQQAIAQANRHNRMLALGFLDLDEFKPINDQYGHEAGDEVLLVTARRMLDCLRGDDSVARLGGDEFVFLLSSVQNEKESDQAIARLRAAIEAPITLSNGISVRVSASFGVSFYPRDGETPEILVRHADQAMYLAKSTGIGHAYFSPPESPLKQA